MGSERTHGKRKVAQLKLQLLLSVDKPEHKRYASKKVRKVAQLKLQ